MLPIEKQLLLELESCHKNCNKGIIIQPSLKNLSQWQIYLFPASGTFKSCIITCFIYFENFPNSVPQIVFQSGVFHPLVDHSTFKYDTSRFCSEWSLQNRVYNLLNSVLDSFVDIQVPSKSAANMEAVKYLNQGMEQYQKRALDELPAHQSPKGNSEIDTPKRWNAQKEKLVYALFQKSDSK